MTVWGSISVALAGVAVLGVLLSAVCHWRLWWVLRGRRLGAKSTDRVTVLKPLCGADAGLDRNLEAFAHQTYRNLEIVFGVASSSDEALPIALRFCRDHQGVTGAVSVGEAASVLNPKVALLQRMASKAEGRWLVVSDSNVRVERDYVEHAMSHVAPDVGLVTHVVAGKGGRSLAARCENLQLNCFVAPALCGAGFLAGRTCVIGKSMFLRREALDAIGGFASAGGYLAEDYAIGQAVEKAGYRVMLASRPVVGWHEGWSFSRFVNRHLRWAIMRRQVSKAGYLLEPLFTPGPILTFALLAALVAPEPHLNIGAVCSALALKYGLDALTYAKLTGERLPLSVFAINPFREWLTLAVWALGWFTQTIHWRGKPYRVVADSALEPVNSSLEAEVGDEV